MRYPVPKKISDYVPPNFLVVPEMKVSLKNIIVFDTYINKEIEADINALKIYLAIGYSKRDALQSFLEVFKDSFISKNRKRYDIIKDYIINFENKTFT